MPEASPVISADISHYMREGTLRLASLPPLSLYIHLPWCLKKCPYCDFNSHEMSAGVAADVEQRYINALVADLESSLPLVWGRTVHSIFIGGGTPSLFSPQSIDQLLAAVRARLRLEAGCEITLEANPGTFEKDRFKAFRAAGVTRLSVGVQSFQDAHLKALGRVHNSAQAQAALTEAAMNFEAFNIDLMYALPGQTLAQCEADVNTALSFAPPHLSIYHLTIEPNTYFAKHTPSNLPEDDMAYDMLDRITELTQAAGLQRYEVSAFAKSGKNSVHNSNYWQFGDYLGIGAGAHGKLSFAHRIVRIVKAREPKLYMDKALSLDARRATVQETEIARADLPFEFMLNALRLTGGFALADFYDRTGLGINAISEPLAEAERKGLIERDFTHVRPTARGLDFLSDLQALFLA
jgi:putative oxygen-independent coproporphyrinogen III oxidase